MTKEDASALLAQHGQEHVLGFWDELTEAERTELLRQIEALDFDEIARKQALLDLEVQAAPEKGQDNTTADIEPAPVLELGAIAARRETCEPLGIRALQAGRIGVLLVAGGQGSRLGFDGPKGVFPIGPISEASLFEIHARKILALEARYDAQIPFYIMTSQANDADTRAFFEQHQYFGLSRERVQFFSQGMWPALSKDGTLLMESRSRIFMNPDGHGGTIRALEKTGMFADMDSRGVDTLFYFQVDNPLVEVADPVFLGLHLQEGAEVSIKVCAKRDAYEKLGAMVLRNGRPSIVEYSELTPEQAEARGADGSLRLRFGSVAIHVFSVAFLKQCAQRPMPLHLAHKQIPHLDSSGRDVRPEKPNAYKFETFIFDVIPESEQVLAVEFDRALEFSPVKNAEGEDSPATTQRDMIRKFAGWMRSCGVAVPQGPDGEPRYRIEIDPCYAVSAAELQTRLGAGFIWDGDLLLVAEEEE